MYLDGRMLRRVLLGAARLSLLLGCYAAMIASAQAGPGVNAVQSDVPNACYDDRLGKRSGLSAIASAEVIDQRMIGELLSWIERSTNYDTAKTRANPPSVSYCATGDTIRYGGRDLIVDGHLKAAYDLERRQIFLVLPWTWSDTRDRSRLLHELIHDVQFQNRAWSCPQATEWEAYSLQDRWLRQNGMTSGFNWVEIHILSHCTPSVHR